MTVVRPSAVLILSRVAAAIVGGYAFTWGFIALGAMVLLAAGMKFHEATMLARMLGALVYVVMFCFAIAAPRVGRTWAWLLGPGVLMSTVAWLLSRMLT